jgi:Lrp/AsnC family transcriptional regulator, leucine-responsive regulatory protein
MDRIDVKILRTLMADAKISNAQLAEQVGLSASPCWQRVRRMEQEGIITGYAVQLDQAKLGASEVALVEIALDRHEEDVLEAFGRAVSKIPEILEVYLTTGEYDYLLKVAVSGTSGYEEFLRTKLYRIPGIRHSRSSFTLKCLKQVQAYVPEA